MAAYFLWRNLARADRLADEEVVGGPTGEVDALGVDQAFVESHETHAAIVVEGVHAGGVIDFEAFEFIGSIEVEREVGGVIDGVIEGGNI